MAVVARAYTFTDGTDAFGSQVENEFTTIYNAWNNHDAGTSKWTVVSASNASAAPLIADNVAGTNDIVNFKDNGTTVFKVADGGNTTIGAGNLIFGTTGKGITGTTTNDSAAALNVGEYIATVQGTSTNFPTTVQYGDLGSISLTAGDWDVSFLLDCQPNGATVAFYGTGYGTVTGNDSTGLLTGQNFLFVPTGGTTASTAICVASVRVSISGTTTIYHKVIASYTGGPPQYRGRISARRVR